MKKKLFTRLTLVAATVVSSFSAKAQTEAFNFTFDSDVEGLTAGGSSSLSHDAGISPNTGLLVLSLGDKNGAVEIQEVISDPTTNKVIRLIYKNSGTTATSLRFKYSIGTNLNIKVDAVDALNTTNVFISKDYDLTNASDVEAGSPASWGSTGQHTFNNIQFKGDSSASGDVLIDQIALFDGTNLSIIASSTIEDLVINATDGSISTNKGEIISVANIAGQQVGREGLISGIYFVTVKSGSLVDTVKVYLN